MSGRTWKCQRQTAGIKCKHDNPKRAKRCERCSKPRSKRNRPAHMAALAIPYASYVAINGGELCGICGEPPKPARRLNRDHEHAGNGKPRGLLCAKCNRFLVKQRYGLIVTPEWLRAAADYLERTI